LAEVAVGDEENRFIFRGFGHGSRAGEN
jgi:hypothetical protein